MPKYGVFSGPYFPVFRLNREKYGPEKLCIWTFLTQWKSIDTHLLSNPWSFQKNLLLMAKYPKKFIWKFSSKTESAFRVMQGHIIDISYVSTHYHVPMSSALNVCHPTIYPKKNLARFQTLVLSSPPQFHSARKIKVYWLRKAIGTLLMFK